MKAFTDLDAWKKSRQLRNEISHLCKSLPSDERFRLCDQIIRSSRSIGANIAEGHGRFHYIDSSKFYVYARGSASETIDHLIVALDEKYITRDEFDRLKFMCEECMKLINGYVNFLRQQVATNN